MHLNQSIKTEVIDNFDVAVCGGYCGHHDR